MLLRAGAGIGMGVGIGGLDNLRDDGGHLSDDDFSGR